MAQADPQLCGRQPRKAAYERDYGRLAAVLAEHYAGNDANVGTLMAGVLAAFDGISVEDFEAKSDAFLRTAKHPALDRRYLECAYGPMVELPGYLKRTGSLTTSPPAAAVISCGRSARRCTGFRVSR